ncbi:MAG: D-alanine--D-alanine ligase family protein [Polyangiales bacterium]
MTKRIRVAVLYGGKSCEHDVSLESAKCVLEHLDLERFEVLPIAIDRDGVWHAQELKRLQGSHAKALPVDATGAEVTLAGRPEGAVLRGALGGPIDVVFPVMHGPLCEDGSVQGLLELCDVAYVGAGVLGSAIAMDKDVAKRLVRAAGIDTVEYVSVRAGQWPAQARAVRERVQNGLGFPVFVKPANLGSSVGVTKVAMLAELDRAIDDALAYDSKILIERAVDARELELAVLESLEPGDPPQVSLAGEIIPRGGFYSYESKYLDPEGAKLEIPAALSAEQSEQARSMAALAFVVLEGQGMARIDLFLERGTGRLLFSEANTIPGFTTISMYPKLWERSGLPYPALLSRLIELALRRHAQRKTLKHER